MRFNCFLALFILFTTSQAVKAQSKFSLMPGAFYNGGGFKDQVQGYGLILGLEYMQRKDHFFSLELRTRYGYYSFNDGTKWTEDMNGVLIPPENLDKARLEYSLFSPQAGVVPKLHLHVDESLSLFLENEVSAGLMTGSFTYGGQPYTKKSFTEPIFSYNIGIGAEYKEEGWSLVGSIGYSTLNFRNKIRKHQPQNYQGVIPNQSAGLMITAIFKIPLVRK